MNILGLISQLIGIKTLRLTDLKDIIEVKVTTYYRWSWHFGAMMIDR